MSFFGFQKKPDPAEQVKAWQRSVKVEIRHLERDIAALEKAEVKHVSELRKLAGRDKSALMISAKSLVQSRRVRAQPSMHCTSLFL